MKILDVLEHMMKDAWNVMMILIFMIVLNV